MDKSTIISQITTLFLMMGIGFFCRKRQILNAGVNKGLTDLLLNVTSPFLTISAFQFIFSRQMMVDAGVMLLFAVTAHLAAIFVGRFFYAKIPGDIGKILKFITIFSNCGFMGYPVIGSIFGQRGVFFASIYNAVFNVFVWTYGIFIFTGKSDRQALKSAFLNPGVLSVFIGMFIFLFSIRLPLPLAQTLQMVGGMTTPISMIIIGATLADVKPRDLFIGLPLYYGALVRLLIMPLIALVVLKGLGIKGTILGVCVLSLSMPAAAMSVPLAENNQGDVSFASRIVFFTTLLSVVTIPLIILLL